MREPELTPSDSDLERPGRGKVPGGKALARMLDFQVRRGRTTKVDDATEPEAALTPSDELCRTPSPGGEDLPVVAGLAMAAPGAAAGPRPSTYLTAYRQLGATRPAALAGPLAAPATAFATTPGETAATPAPDVPRGWRPLGPFAVPHGQSYGSGSGSRPPVAGRISAVAPDPSNGEHLLIAAGGGGVWESFDRGITWAPRTDDQPSLSIGALVFDPSDPALVYAGTGEGDTFSWLGLGVLRSTDGGTTWALHATTPFQGVAFYDLVVDPLDGDHLLAATTAGIFESGDGGAQWVRRRATRTWSLSFQPADPADPAAPREVLAGCRDGVFRSTNGGASWQRLALSGLASTPARVEVCHAPSDRRVAYVVAAGPPNVPDPKNPQRSMPRPTLFRRDTPGGSFAPIPPPPTLQTGQAFYDWFAGVAPDDADVLYVGGINAHKGIRSPTGAWTWTNISARATGTSIHPDQHAIAFDPIDPEQVYIGNDGGIYASDDGGASWRSLNKGLGITEFQSIAQHARLDAWLIGGTQDNGTLRYEALGTWFHVRDGDGGDCGANATDPHTCYHTFFGMGMERSTDGGGWGTWDWIGPPIKTADTYPDGSLFYPPMEVRDDLVVQAGRSVFLSRDRGNIWRKINLPTTGQRASTLAIASADRVLVGTEAGRVYAIDFASGSWRKAEELGRPTQGFLSDLRVDPNNGDRLWATCSDLGQPGVFRSDDGGQTWITLVSGLPTIPINAIEIDPTSPDTLFVAADVGVYRSFDAGQTWNAFSEGLPNALVKDLLFHAPTRLLRAATQSRGVWEIPVDRTVVPAVEVYLRDSVVDTGSRVPSPSGVDDPFQRGERVRWWNCPDIKVDPQPFQIANPEAVDFEVFVDDREHVAGGIDFATGLRHRSPVRGEAVRVYVQFHNRGLESALGVTIRLYAAELGETPTGLTVPSLPAGFFASFPDGSPAADAPWQPIADAAIVDEVAPGRSAVVFFEWAVPADLGDFAALLAAVGAENDALAIDETRVTVLAPGDSHCGFKVVEVVDG